ncbi:MAG: GntR family transcriptional regulator [Trueperella sp.]|nr:GntR family transcriptional regulator [Trueperella sp.]
MGTLRGKGVNIMANGSQPLYRRIADELLSAIESGKLISGSQLPTEHELAREFDVNRLTVRRAISELQRVGAVEIQRGRGTFVSTPPDLIEVVMNVGHSAQRSDSIQETLASGSTFDTREYIASIYADPELPIECDELTHEVIRIDTRMMRGRQLWILNSYYIDARYSDIAPAVDEHGFVIRALRNHYGLSLEYRWRAFSAEAANFEDAAQFGVATGTPLLVRDGVTALRGGEPLFYVRRRLLGERAKFVLHYTREAEDLS